MTDSNGGMNPGGHHHRDRPGDETSGRSGRPRALLSMWSIMALAVIGIIIYLVVDHWPHVLAVMPYFGIVAFAAMHLLGHGGHHGHGGPSQASDKGLEQQ